MNHPSATHKHSKTVNVDQLHLQPFWLKPFGTAALPQLQLFLIKRSSWKIFHISWKRRRRRSSQRS